MDFFKGTVTRKDWMAVGVILAVTLILGAFYVFFVHTRQTEKLAALEADLRAAESELAEAKKLEANIAALREETAKVEGLVEAFQDRLPDQREIPLLLKQFEDLAKEVNLEVQLAMRDVEVGARKETIPYSVTAHGTFHQIASFINRLERHKRYLKISNLSISEQKDGKAEAKFTLSTFSFKQPAANPAQSKLASAEKAGVQ